MKVHFYTKGDIRTADSRQRAHRIAEEFRTRGLDAVVHEPPVLFLSTVPWPRKGILLLQFLKTLLTIKKDDVVFLQRTISNKYFFVSMAFYLLVFRRKMVFDFDDAIYMHNPIKTKVFTRLASAVFICSEPLQQWASRYNSHVHLFHTTVKYADYALHTKDYSVENTGPVVIGWIGTAKDHYKNLTLLAEGFSLLCTKDTKPFRFVLVGEKGHTKARDLFLNIKGLSVEFVDFIDPSHTPRMIQSFDIGVNPLAERGEWNLSRSSFKPYEYMACGVAQITSDVGEITRVVIDGQNGFLAHSSQEWADKLALLINEPQLRARLGEAGQETIRTEESYEVLVPRMIEIIRSL